LGAGREHESREAADEHQREPHHERRAVPAHQHACFGPRVRVVDFLLLDGFGHGQAEGDKGWARTPARRADARIVPGSFVMMPLTAPAQYRRARAGSSTVQTCVVAPARRAIRANRITGSGMPLYEGGIASD